jgi:hypothetical protein
MEYYTYAYLREDRTPYYIGKGSGFRMYDDRGKSCYKPIDKNRIIILKYFDIEFDAFKHEMYMISVFGRKDLGTGILHNRTDGGDGCNRVITEETRAKMSESQKGKKLTEEHKRKISESGKGRKVNDESRKKYSDAAKKRWSKDNDCRREKLIQRNKSDENIKKVSYTQKNKWESKSDLEKEKIIKNLIDRNKSQEQRKKLSDANKKWWNQLNESIDERKRKLIEKNKSYKGMLFWNDGQNQIRSVECPGTNWKRGRLKKSDF